MNNHLKAVEQLLENAKENVRKEIHLEYSNHYILLNIYFTLIYSSIAMMAIVYPTLSLVYVTMKTNPHNLEVIHLQAVLTPVFTMTPL